MNDDNNTLSGLPLVSTPTLRYAREKVYIGCGDWEWQERLQQLWVTQPKPGSKIYPEYEWRDVPTVKI